MCFFRMTSHGFETFRLAAVVATVCLKIVLMPWYLQAYLDMAYHRVEEQKKEAGRITNKEFQKKVLFANVSICKIKIYEDFFYYKYADLRYKEVIQQYFQCSRLLQYFTT